MPDDAPRTARPGAVVSPNAARLSRSSHVQMPLPAAPDLEPDPDTWFEHVPTNPSTPPRLRDLAAYAGPDSFYQDHQDRAVTVPLGPPGTYLRTEGSEADAPPRGNPSSSRIAPLPDSAVRLDAAAIERLTDDEVTDDSPRPGEVTSTSRILQPRSATALVAVICLIIGVVLGALLFGQRSSPVIHCPDLPARSN